MSLPSNEADQPRQPHLGSDLEDALSAARQKMRDAAVDPLAIEAFTQYFAAVAAGETGLVGEDEILPFHDPSTIAPGTYSPGEMRAAMQQTAVIKLNGGLGTSMGLDRAKTLLPVREGKNFLDIIAGQVSAARERFDALVPVIFMNSYRTDADTTSYLQRYPELPVDGLPLSFLQSQEPRLDARTLTPIGVPVAVDDQWCPPGHGDLYVSLQSSGVLEQLLAAGMRYAQVSNGDNLGANPDAEVAAWFAASGAPFAMEVSRRTINDRKGGHLARRKTDGALVLRESAQTSPADRESFEDVDRHPFFNTNTIWLDLEALHRALSARGGVLPLPVIRNRKQITDKAGQSLEVIQIETAMGAAIEVFAQAVALEVPRSRFLPVKTTNELLLLRSDLYRLDVDDTLHLVGTRTPEVRLANRYYAFIDDFDARIPDPPSLREAISLSVEGDWFFLPGAKVTGDVILGPEGGSFGPA